MSSIKTLDGADETIRALEANKSPRYKRLEELERWSLGCQYDGRPNWFDDSVPRWERAPCLVYPIVAIAAASNVDMVLGEGRYPTLTAGPEDEGPKAKGSDKAEEPEVPEGGLSTEDSKHFDRFLRDYLKLARFPAHLREAFFTAQVSGTAVGIYGVREGRPFCDTISAKWCTPTLTPLGEVTRLEIKYPYPDEYKKPDGTYAVRAMLYRRVIDEVSDTIYKPALAREDGREPSWAVEATVQHGLGFCPVVWWAFNKGCQAVNALDGKAIHALLTDEIFAHDLALSTRHQGALLSEPQIVEIGVVSGYNPTDEGQTPLVPTTLHGGPITPDNPVTGGFVDSGRRSKPARKKGGGYVWQYQSPDTKVETLVYPGDALKGQDDNARDIRIKLQEALAVVFLDPENLKIANTISGKALDSLKQRQVDRCDQYRDDIADGFITPALNMQVKIAAKVDAKKVRTLKKALPSIAKTPDVRIVWGPYSRPDPTEQLTIVQLVMAALGQGGDDPIITKEIALQKLAKIFDIENTQAVLGQLEEEKLERQEQAHEQAKQEAELNGDPSADREGSGGSEGKPPKAA